MPVSLPTCQFPYQRASFLTNMPVSLPTCQFLYQHASFLTSVPAFLSTCQFLYQHASFFTNMPVSLPTCQFLYQHASFSTNMQVSLPTWQSLYQLASFLTNMPVSLPTCQFPYQHASFSFLFYVLFVLFSKESSFRVKGGEGKCLIRIGAKHLNCLLHIAEWGMTLALERTHAVLSQWPLTTIRNYECTDDNEFVFEAGRKSPMGEGKYHFHTTNNEDNTIFDQLDRYTSLRAKRVQSSSGRRRLDSGDDDMEIAQAYGKLRWSVMLNDSTLNLGGRLTGD